MALSAMAPNATKAVISFSITFSGRDGMAHIRTGSPRALIVGEFPRPPQEIAPSTGARSLQRPARDFLCPVKCSCKENCASGDFAPLAQSRNRRVRVAVKLTD